MRLGYIVTIGFVLALALALSVTADSTPAASQQRMEMTAEELHPKNDDVFPISIETLEGDVVQFKVYACGKVLTFKAPGETITTKAFEDFVTAAVDEACK